VVNAFLSFEIDMATSLSFGAVYGGEGGKEVREEGNHKRHQMRRTVWEGALVRKGFDGAGQRDTASDGRLAGWRVGGWRLAVNTWDGTKRHASSVFRSLID